MPREIESAVEIAQKHVQNVENANKEFTDVGVALNFGVQINQPTYAMRKTFENANNICTNLCSYLGGDVKKILLMAEEFELWDQQTGNQNG